MEALSNVSVMRSMPCTTAATALVRPANRSTDRYTARLPAGSSLMASVLF